MDVLHFTWLLYCAVIMVDFIVDLIYKTDIWVLSDIINQMTECSLVSVFSVLHFVWQSLVTCHGSSWHNNNNSPFNDSLSSTTLVSQCQKSTCTWLLLIAVFISDLPFCYYWYYTGFDNTATVTAHLTTLYLWQFWWDSARKALRLMYVYIMFDDNNGCCLPSVLKGWCPAVTGDSKTRCITFLETEECWQSCSSFTTSIHWGEVVSFGGRQESEQNCQYEEWQSSEAKI